MIGVLQSGSPLLCRCHPPTDCRGTMFCIDLTLHRLIEWKLRDKTLPDRIRHASEKKKLVALNDTKERELCDFGATQAPVLP